jgi:hypothetical protein
MSVKSGERKVRLTVQVTTSKNAAEIFFLGGEVRGGWIKGTHKYQISYLRFKTGNKFGLLYYWKDAINLKNIFVHLAKQQLYFRRHFTGIVTTWRALSEIMIAMQYLYTVKGITPMLANVMPSYRFDVYRNTSTKMKCTFWEGFIPV